ICRDEQCVVPLRIEQRRQRVRLVMIVEKDMRVVAKAACLPEFGDIENVVDMRGVVAQKFMHHIAARIFLDVFAVFFPNPTRSADVGVEFGRKLAAAGAQHIDVFAPTGSSSQLKRCPLYRRKRRSFGTIVMSAVPEADMSLATRGGS